MAEDVEMTPVEMTPVAAAEPPKVNPLKPAGIKLPPKPGATVSALKPGLKLPPKPGATVSALKPGLKLPPKPGATVSALKPGLKLPPKPGATLAMPKPGAATAATLKPGLKLPPKPGATLAAARPVIRKPGEGPAATAIPKPVAKPVVPVDAQGVGKLPTVEAKPLTREDVAATPATGEPMKPLDALKSVTQKLKGVTQQIPQQAILHKTGIIADSASTDAQKEAAKHKTARISLSDAMGVAPVKNEPAPMKTIRIKRPVNLPGAPATSAAPAAEKPAETGATSAATGATDPGPSVTQRKTLKITRPGTAVRPAGKFGVKKPGVTTAPTKPAAAAEGGDVPEIADIPDLPPTAPVPTAKAEAPAGIGTILSVIVEIAACVVIGALVWYFYQDAQMPTFCGGLGWAS